MSAPQNRQLRLARIPVGLIAPADFALATEPVPEPGEGQALVRTTFISLDPTNRIWANGAPSYLPANVRACDAQHKVLHGAATQRCDSALAYDGRDAKRGETK